MFFDSLQTPLILVAGVLAAGAVYFWYSKCSKSLSRSSATPSKPSSPVLLENDETKYEVKLIEKEKLSHDTRRFRFSLPSEKHVLGLPVGQHIYLSARILDKMIVRPYTPVTSDDDHGYFDLVIKVYFANVNPRFPEGGKLTQYMEAMNIGDSIPVRGPSGNLIYRGNGSFAIRKNKTSPFVISSYKKVGMIAGGTGITPMLQLVEAVLKNPSDQTQLWLLFANQTESDILLRDRLTELAKQRPDQFKLWFTVDRSESGWQYSTGFVNADMIKEHLPAPSTDTLVLLCGPPPMIKFACDPNLDKLSYPAANRFAY